MTDPDADVSAQGRDGAWRYRLAWLLADRVALGFVVAIIAFTFNAYLQRDQRVGEYQKLLFERRVKAYEDLVASARDARDRCALAYRVFLATRPLPKTADIAWQARLAAASDGIWGLAYSGSSAGGDTGGDDGAGGGDAGDGIGMLASRRARLSQWEASTLSDAIKALRELERRRTEAALFISGSVNLHLDQLLETLLGDVEALQRRIGAGKGRFASSMSSEDQRIVERALLRAEESYGSFLRAVTDALRVKEVILG